MSDADILAWEARWSEVCRKAYHGEIDRELSDSVVVELQEIRNRLDGRFTAKVEVLRRLGASLLDAKKAVDEAEGDVGTAAEMLRARHQMRLAPRKDRAESGVIATYVSEGNTSGVLLELRCQSDFVAKGEKFLAVAHAIAAHVADTSPADVEALLVSEITPEQTVYALLEELGHVVSEKIVCSRFALFTDGYVAVQRRRLMPDLPPQVGAMVQLNQASADVARAIAQHIIAFAPKYLNREDVPAETVQTERLLAESAARYEGESAAAQEEFVDGRVNEFFKMHVLLDQPFGDGSETVQTVLDEAGVSLMRFARFRVGS
ncbi:translation elongation factor Ts [Streptomyces scabiei]|uniref:translation elongation factor Ts n=1 Tax=Streptomyces scabiei TaxID=1930 RepID=UPI00099BA8FA|nr:translation elongation factor Ts [Streptomyces scabiei]